MSKLPTMKEAKTIIVLASRAAVTTKGQVGMVFHTKQMGTIVFPMGPREIDSLRESLDEMEEYLINFCPEKAN